MGSSKGYLLPEILDPPDNICIAVEVPNDPGYIRAFFGAYEYLGYWFAWERDALKRGKDAAARWRLAALETHINYERWGNLCALEINVNCGGGGCGCSYEYTPTEDYGQVTPEQVEQFFQIPDGLVDDGTNPPTADWGTYEEYQAYKCAAAIRLADDLLDTFNRVGSLGGTLLSMSIAGATAFITTSFASSIVGLLAAFLTPFGAVALILSLIIATFTVSLRYLYIFGQIRQSLSRDDLICAFYNAGNPLAARSSLIEQIQTTYGGLPWGDADQTIGEDFILNFLDYIAPDELFNALFGRLIGYDTGTDFDCSLCGPGAGMDVIMVLGTHDGTGWFTTAEGTTNNSAGCEQKLDLWFGTDTVPDTAPYATVNTLYWEDGWPINSSGGGTSMTLYRPAGLGGDVIVTSQAALDAALPLANVEQIKWSGILPPTATFPGPYPGCPKRLYIDWQPT